MVATVETLRGISRLGEEIRNATPGDAAVGDNLVKMLDDVFFSQYWKVCELAIRGVDPTLSDDLSIIE